MIEEAYLERRVLRRVRLHVGRDAFAVDPPQAVPSAGRVSQLLDHMTPERLGLPLADWLAGIDLARMDPDLQSAIQLLRAGRDESAVARALVLLLVESRRAAVQFATGFVCRSPVPMGDDRPALTAPLAERLAANPDDADRAAERAFFFGQ